MRCSAQGCSNDATLWYGCGNLECPDFIEIYTCDAHQLPGPLCPICVEPMGTDSVANVVQRKNSIDPDGMVYGDVADDLPVTPTALVQSCVTQRVTYDSRLGVVVEICNGTNRALLAHSLDRLRVIERQLRPWAGISTSGGVSGPNIALGELRMLFTDASCGIYQFAFRIIDTRERTLVFRSTGGTVLVPKAELLRLQNEQTNGAISAGDQLVLSELEACATACLPLVRCYGEATQSDFTVNRLYVMTGAYSFFKPPQGEQSVVLAAAAGFKVQHEGAYKNLVNIQGSPEQYHHSEQAFFRMLHVNHELLYDAALVASQLNLLPDSGPLVLEALAIDVFTTRAACGNCMKTAVAVMENDQHFCKRALPYLAEKMPHVDVSKVRKYVRFDCDFPFSQTAIPDGLSASSAILHGRPGHPLPLNFTDTAEVLFVAVAANAVERGLLDNGMLRSYAPEILSLLTELERIAKNPSAINETAAQMDKHLKPSALHHNVFVAAWFTNRYYKQHVSRALAEEVLRCADSDRARNLTEAQKKLASKIYYMIALLLACRFNLKASLVMAGCGATLLGADMLDDGVFNAICVAYSKHTDGTLPDGSKGSLFAEIRKQMRARVDELFEEARNGDATAENAARTLAVQYGVLDHYLSKLS